MFYLFAAFTHDYVHLNGPLNLEDQSKTDRTSYMIITLKGPRHQSPKHIQQKLGFSTQAAQILEVLLYLSSLALAALGRLLPGAGAWFGARSLGRFGALSFELGLVLGSFGNLGLPSVCCVETWPFSQEKGLLEERETSTCLVLALLMKIGLFKKSESYIFCFHSCGLTIIGLSTKGDYLLRSKDWQCCECFGGLEGALVPEKVGARWNVL